jgi:hypothetical protein
MSLLIRGLGSCFLCSHSLLTINVACGCEKVHKGLPILIVFQSYGKNCTRMCIIFTYCSLAAFIYVVYGSAIGLSPPAYVEYLLGSWDVHSTYFILTTCRGYQLPTVHTASTSGWYSYFCHRSLSIESQFAMEGPSLQLLFVTHHL